MERPPIVPTLAASEGAGPPAPPDDSFSKWKGIIGAGEEKAAKDRSAYDKFVKLFQTGQYADRDKGVSVNETFAYIKMVGAMLYSQGPTYQTEPADNADVNHFAPVAQLYGGPEAAARAFADSIETFLTRAYEAQEFDLHNNAAIFNALTRGQAITKISFDAARQMPAIDTLRRDEIFVDPHARYSLRQAGYVVHTVVKRFDEARIFFDRFGVKLAEPNFKLSTMGGLAGQRMGEAGQSEADQYKFYEIWRRTPEGEKRLYYMAYRGEDWLYQDSWPFTLDYDDYPFAVLHFNTQYSGIQDAFPELQTVDGLREMYEECAEFSRRHTLRGIATPVLLDADAIDEPQLKQLSEARDMAFLRVQKGNKRWDELIKVVNLIENQTPALDLAERNLSAWQRILGYDDLMRVATTSKLTATHAEILDSFSKQRSGDRQKQVDLWQTKIARVSAQIARQLVDPQKIQQMVGDEAALLWSLYAGNAEDFTADYSITIEAGSTGERAKAIRLRRLAEFYDRGAQYNQRQAAMGRMPDFDEREVLLEMARQDAFRRPERYFVKPQEQPAPPAPGPEGLPPTIPGNEPPGTPGAGVATPSPAGPVTPGGPSMPPAGEMAA